jgi:acyl-CoA synthetase (AMP-forming)/AMP-acid ligase II
MNTIEFLQISSAVVPDREALVEIGGGTSKRITFEEMYPRVVKLANALQSLGIEKGQKIATMPRLSNRMNWLSMPCFEISQLLAKPPGTFRQKSEPGTPISPGDG